MSARYYLDTSVFVEVLVGSPASESILVQFEGSELVSSVLLVAEARRTLTRLSREGRIDPARYLLAQERVDQSIEDFELRDVTLDFCDQWPMPAVATPRTADLIHLRTALWFHARAPLTCFISFDVAQIAAARELGLPTER